jgi:hypothetical protein
MQMSGPTHRGFWIDPRVLVERSKEAAKDGVALLGIADQVLALLRLAPDRRPEALTAARGIGAEVWQLNPNAVYPVDLMAPPILRGERSAVARSGQVAWIELGPFWPRLGLLQKLAKRPAIDVKTAQGVQSYPSTDSIVLCWSSILA